METVSPLLRVGSFGTHVISGHSGCSFAGSVPVNLANKSFPTEAAAIAAFVAWFKSQDVEFQRENIGNTRNDVFALIVST